MPSQISKITMRRHLLFKCHCNKIYFLFPKVIVSLTYPGFTRISLQWHILYHSKRYLSHRKSYQDVEQLTMCSKLCKQYWIMEDLTDFKIVCPWGTSVILMPLHVLLSRIFSNISCFHNIQSLVTWMPSESASNFNNTLANLLFWPYNLNQ